VSRLGGWATAFGRFWWDFLIGDDWTIAAGVLVALALTWALTSVDDFPAWIVLPAAGAVLVAQSVRRAAR